LKPVYQLQLANS